jgi:sugar phosphate isomerase/epimerase
MLSMAAGLGLLVAGPVMGSAPAGPRDVFVKDNLVAWCIVPFDAKRRGPTERAEMLHRLGIKKVAYDWRQEHVPTFEEEILAYQKHGLEYFAFWGWHPQMARLIAKHGIQPQVWQTSPSPQAETPHARVEAAAKQLLPLVQQTRQLGCKFGLYNHGGWGGEPENLVAIVEWLQDHTEADHVGIVYNFHHGHGHIHDFAEVLARMKPYLLCLNLNGMNDNANPMILPLAKGQHDRAMLQIIRASGYAGPIGILDHRGQLDAEESLRQNLDGMKKLLEQMGDKAAAKTY